MGDQAILVQMLGDIQTRLGRIESTQGDIQQEVSSVSTRVAVVEEHCRSASCVPKATGATGSYLGLSVGAWLRYAAIALVTAYGLGKVQTAEQRTDVLVKAITKAKIIPDSCLVP
jgi:hypothetical protein